MDRDKALALELVELEMCPQCHTLREDWIDEKTNQPHFPPLLEAVAHQCPGCAEFQRTHASIPDRIKGAYVAFMPFDPEVDRSPVLAEPPPSEPVSA